MNEEAASRKEISVEPIGFVPITGRRVRLERTGMQHVSFLEQCFHDADFMQLYRLSQSRKVSREKLEEWLSSEQESTPQHLKRIEWVVNLLGKPGPIGLAALANYSTAHNRAELLIGIQNPRYRGTFLPLEASYLVFDFAFNHIKLHKLVSFVYGHNQHAQTSTMHLGLKQEGYLNKHIWNPYKKEFVDTFQNGLLVEDFRSNARIGRLSKRLLGRDITLTPPTLKNKKLSVIQSEEIKQKLVNSQKKQRTV